MTTWLDSQPEMVVRTALGSDAEGSDLDERRFNLWLALVDLHLDELNSQRPLVEWEWRSGYQDGWSPRTAAFAAWAKNPHGNGQGGQAAINRACA
jgi:hypothetical protein